MGHKVHPIGFRTGIIRDWQAKWYADKNYADFLHEDLKLRQAIQSKYDGAGVSLVEIDRQANKVSITIHTARPGVVIGRGGQRVDEVRHHLEDLVGKRIQLNILEIQQPELDAYLVAKSVAEQMERRVAYRRAMKQAVFRTIQAGAKGVRISCAGRLGGAEIARRQTMHEGQVPLHTIRADIDYGFTEARTALGRIGVKVWIYKGEIFPEPKEQVVEEVTDELADSESKEALPAAKAEAAESIEVPPTAEPEVSESIEVPPTAEPEVSQSIEVPPTAEPEVSESIEVPPTAEPEVSESIEVSPAAKAKGDKSKETPPTAKPKGAGAKSRVDVSSEENDGTT